jgi:hypothetical protein
MNDRIKMAQQGYEFLMNQLTVNNIENNTRISFNHPVKSFLFSFQSKKEKECNKYDIDFICNKFKKLCIPLTYNEYISKLSPEEKYRLEYIDTIEEQMKIKLLNLENIFI